MADTGFLQAMFSEQLQQAELARRQAMQEMMAPFASGLGGLGGALGGFSPLSGQQVMPNRAIQERTRPTGNCNPIVEKTLSFIQNLRNEIDEWLKL